MEEDSSLTLQLKWKKKGSPALSSLVVEVQRGVAGGVFPNLSLHRGTSNTLIYVDVTQQT